MARWRAVLVLCITETISWGVLYYSFGVLLGPVKTALRASDGAIAGAFSAALLAAGLASSPLGRAIDRWGARTVMTAATALAALSLAAHGIVQSIVALYLVWILIGVSHAGVLYEPAFAGITRWFPEEKARSRALLAVTICAGFASTIFVPLTASLSDAFGWRTTSTVFALVLALIVLPLHATLPGRGAATSIRHHRAALSGAPSPRTRGDIALLSCVFAAHSFASAAIAVHLVTRLTEAGSSLPEAARLAGLVGAAQVPGRLLFHSLSRIARADVRLSILLAVQAPALIGMGAADGPLMMTSALVFGAANGLVTLERATIVADWFGADRYGSVSGRIASLALAARAGAPVAVGLLKESTSYAAAFCALSLMLALSAIGLTIGAGRRRSSVV